MYTSESAGRQKLVEINVRQGSSAARAGERGTYHMFMRVVLNRVGKKVVCTCVGEGTLMVKRVNGGVSKACLEDVVRNFAFHDNTVPFNQNLKFSMNGNWNAC